MGVKQWWTGHGPAEKAAWGAGILAAVATLVGAMIETVGGGGSGTAAPVTPSPAASVTTPATPTSPTSDASPSEEPSSPEPSGDASEPVAGEPSALPDTALLADLDHVYDDNNFGGVKAVHIGGQLYDSSPGQGCLTSRSLAVEWNTAGYTKFGAVLGIDDSDDEGSRISIHIKFADQDGVVLKNTVTVSAGHPAKVAFPLKDATRLRVECLAEDKSGSDRIRHVTLRLGDATVG